MAYLIRRHRVVNGEKRYGNWEIRYKDDGGKSSTLTTGTRLKTVAMNKLAEFIADRKRTDRFKDIYLQDFNERILKYVQTNLPRSVKVYRTALNNFIRAAGSVKVQSIDINTIEDYKSHRLASVSPQTVNIEVRTIKAAFNKGVELKLIPESKINKVRIVRIPRRNNKQIFSDTELELLQNNIHYMPLFRAFTIARFTGMRLGEILNLQMSDIQGDFINIINKADFHIKDSEERNVPISPNLRYYLNLWIASDPTEYIVSKEVNRYRKEIGKLQCNWISKYFKKVLRELNIDGRFHYLRHTFATNFLRNGGDIEILRSILGHSDIKTTAIYLHSDDEAKLKAVKNM